MYSNGLYALAVWLFLFPAVYLTGTLAARRLDAFDVRFRGLVTMASGFGILCYFIVLLGSLNLLYFWLLLGPLLIVFIFQRRHLADLKNWLRSLLDWLLSPAEGKGESALKAVFLILLPLTVILCFLPELAHDSLGYHINLPKLFVRNHSVLPMIYDLKSYQSQFMECLYTVGICFRSVTVAKLFHWVISVLFVLCAMVVIEKEAGRKLSRLMGLALLLTPTLFNQMTVTYNDAAVSLYLLLAYVFFEHGLSSRRLSAFFISGLMTGFAVSSKYLALMTGTGMGLILVWRIIAAKGDRGFYFKALVVYSFGTFLTGSYWFIRNFILQGNPLYPIFTSRFGGAGLYTEQNYNIIGVPRTLANFLLLPVYTVIYPDPFERHHWMGPFYLMLLPFSLYGGLRSEKGRRALFIVLVTLSLWFRLAQCIRFMLPVFPLLLMTGAMGIRRFLEKKRHALLLAAGKAAAGLCLLLLLGVGIYHYRIHMKALAFHWSEARFLRTLERTYPAAEWVNANLPKNAKLFTASEIRLFYFDREIIDETSYYRVERYNPDLSPAGLYERLRKAGITHVVLVDNLSSPVEYRADESISQKHRIEKQRRDALEAMAADSRFASPVKVIDSVNVREDRYRYRIFRIEPSV